MKVKEFFDEAYGDISNLEIKKYVPILDKMQTINKTVMDVMDSKESIVVTYNSVSMEISGIIAAINLYTNLEVETLEDYDELCKSNLIIDILSEIGDDYLTFNTYFQMRIKDYEKQLNSADAIISRIVPNIDLETINRIAEIAEALNKA